MKSDRTWMIGIVSSWLVESAILIGVGLIDDDRSYEGWISEVATMPLIVAIGMSPVLLIMTLANFIVDEKSNFWRIELCIPFGFAIGVINYLLIYSAHSGMPSRSERLLWIFIMLSGVPTALGFGIISRGIRKKQT